jgi:hypothetical protein
MGFSQFIKHWEHSIILVGQVCNIDQRENDPFLSYTLLDRTRLQRFLATNEPV